VVTVGAWSTYTLAVNGMLRSKPYTESARNLAELLRTTSLWQYLTAIVLLTLLVIILAWFYPQAADSSVKFYNLTYQGISDGALLALIALGLVLIYKASDVINFAHGELMMIGAYIFSELMVRYRFALSWALIGAAAVMVLIGAMIERAFLRPLIGKPIISVIMVTIGLSNVIGAVVGAAWVNQPQDWQERGTKMEEGFLPLLTGILPEDSGLHKALSTGAYQVFEAERRLPYSFKYESLYLIGIVLFFIFLLGCYLNTANRVWQCERRLTTNKPP
jgi:branched-subunit amino acid ABC-type transport system permease component